MKKIAALIFFLVISIAAFAQVNQGELQQDLPPVTFINYEGPHSRVDTREQIRQIGVGLGSAASNTEGRMGANNRYFIIHSVTGPEGNKNDADIFGLGVDVGVDHVRNLRVIIQGYLQAAYKYTEKDASLLAEYITIYNAVYRGSWDYFTDRYKNAVMKNMAREKAGLSIRYDEWPGRTLLLIPLGYGGLSSVDTSTISDKRVIEEMRKDDDRGVEQRRDMVDLKEREAAQAEQRARTEREAIRGEEQQIARDRQRTDEDRQAGRISQEEARQRDRETDKKEENLEQRREEAKKMDEFAEKKTVEAQEDRKEIAKDQQTVIAQETGGFLGIILDSKNPAMGRLVRMGADGKETKRSPVNTVRVRSVTNAGGRILAVAGENKGNGAIRIIEINQSTLELVKQSDYDIHTNSLIWASGADLYAITIDLKDNSCSIGRFDTNLFLQARSAVKVHAGATVVVQQGRLTTQSENGSVLMLNPADLTEMK